MYPSSMMVPDPYATLLKFGPAPSVFRSYIVMLTTECFTDFAALMKLSLISSCAAKHATEKSIVIIVLLIIGTRVKVRFIAFDLIFIKLQLFSPWKIFEFRILRR